MILRDGQMASDWVYLVTALMGLYVTRAYFIFVERRATSMSYGDEILHLSFVRKIEQQGGGAVNFEDKYPLASDDYPLGFHKICYWLGLKSDWLRRFGFIIPSIIDTLLITITAWIAFSISGQVSPLLMIFPFARVFFAHEGRSIHFNERAFGIMLGNLCLFCLFYFVFVEHMASMLIATFVLYACLACSSKFTVQAVAFIAALVSLLTLNILPVLIILGCIVLSGPVTKCYSWKVMKGHIRHSMAYKNCFSKKNLAIKNNYLELIHYKGIEQYLSMLSTNRVMRIVTDNPFLFLAAVVVVINEGVSPWGAWLLSGLILVILVSTEKLKFLGEPERYLEYCLVPVLIVLSLSEYQITDIPVMLVLVLVVIIFMTHNRDFRSRMRVINKGHKNIREAKGWFSDIHRGLILTIPFRYSFFVAFDEPAESNRQYLTMHTNIGSGQKGEDYRWLLGEKYPFVRRDVESVIKKFEVDYIFVDKVAVKYLHSHIGEYYERFNRFEIMKESNQFMLLDVRNKS